MSIVNIIKVFCFWLVVLLNSCFVVCEIVFLCGGGFNGDDFVYVFKGGFVNYFVYVMYWWIDFFGVDVGEFWFEWWEG